VRYFQRRVKRCQYKHCNAQTPPLNMQYVELLCYKVCMFANLKSVRLDVCLTIFMFVSKTFVNNEFANTKRCSRTSRTHCSRTISVREPCLQTRSPLFIFQYRSLSTSDCNFMFWRRCLLLSVLSQATTRGALKTIKR